MAMIKRGRTPILIPKNKLDRLESFRKDQDATKMKARMELVVGASAAQQLAGWSVVNRPTAFYRARPGPAFTNTNSCYCQNGLKSIFSHIERSKLSVLTPPHPC